MPVFQILTSILPSGLHIAISFSLLKFEWEKEKGLDFLVYCQRGSNSSASHGDLLGGCVHEARSALADVALTTVLLTWVCFACRRPVRQKLGVCAGRLCEGAAL